MIKKTPKQNPTNKQRLKEAVLLLTQIDEHTLKQSKHIHKQIHRLSHMHTLMPTHTQSYKRTHANEYSVSIPTTSACLVAKA